MPNIVLVGFMGTGKTTVGRAIAEKLGIQFIDTDDVIEQKNQVKIADVFAQHGEPYFRDLESQVVREVTKIDNRVISTGGGVVLRPSNLEHLKQNGRVFCLTATPKAIWCRVRGDNDRPLLKSADPLRHIETLLQQRAPYYALADHQIQTTDISVAKVADQIIAYSVAEQPPQKANENLC